MIQKNKILIVDDAASVRFFFREKFADTFDVYEASNGQEGLSLYQEHEFLLVLIDVTMPVMNGFELGKELQRCEPQKKISSSIIFMSASDDEKTILECFDCGADDFIPKVIEGDALIKKINVLLDFKRREKDSAKELSQLNELMHTTMRQASLYGSCLKLLSDINRCNKESAIALHIFSFMGTCGLTVAIQFKNNECTKGFDQISDVCSPIEDRVFEVLREKGRIFEFGKRVVFNDKHFSVLVKNMPEKGSDAHGLLIDVLAKLVPEIDTGYIGLLNRQKLDGARKSAEKIVDQVKEGVMELQRERQKQIDNITLKISLSFHNLDFSNDQEQFLNNLIETQLTASKTSDVIFLEINAALANMVEALKPNQVATIQEESPTIDTELF